MKASHGSISITGMSRSTFAISSDLAIARS